MDVRLLRKDYAKFLKLANTNLNDEIFVQNFKNDPQFGHSFTRLRMNGSIAIQEDWKNLEAHHGLFIDLFVYDVMTKTEEECQTHANYIRMVQEEKMSYLVKDIASNENRKVLN